MHQQSRSPVSPSQSRSSLSPSQSRSPVSPSQSRSPVAPSQSRSSLSPSQSPLVPFWLKSRRLLELVSPSPANTPSNPPKLQPGPQLPSWSAPASSTKQVVGFPSGDSCYDLGGTCHDVGGTCYDQEGTCYDLGGTCYDLRGTGYDLRGTCYDLRGTCYDLGGTPKWPPFFLTNQYHTSLFEVARASGFDPTRFCPA
eukprot:CAMPEP_0196666276 /NCGR_PEP_ID=MMETSP1086-20130531/64422_1 /TAXON_ID=77921 /ORGANISM="Cyanoptyche  gloeocystis , Strain SAG4.97" /LENGTH=196 /DNA_ID=CAMNT_0042003447 /DNA_START=523 /DNA_END=1114 /DNA_ORIENTATION=-